MKQKRIYKVTTIKEDPNIMEINTSAASLMKNYAVEVAEASDRSYTACKYRLLGLLNAINVYDSLVFPYIFRDDFVTLVEVYKSDGVTKLLVVAARRVDTNEGGQPMRTIKITTTNKAAKAIADKLLSGNIPPPIYINPDIPPMQISHS